MVENTDLILSNLILADLVQPTFFLAFQLKP